jgi:outer membrane protein assembly factor BamE (lipoprotein component of BamABCDE complex)
MRCTCLKFMTAMILCLPLVVGCGATRKLKDLSPGMTKPDVISLLGEPEIAREQITNKYDQDIELWHYELYDHHTDAYEPYFLYFYEGKLARWGRAVHLPREKVYEMKFE